MLTDTHDVVDDNGEPPPPAAGGVLFPSGAVELQLQRVEARLIGLAGADPELEREVYRYLQESCARFATARVRQFVPILVEREVRARLRARDLPCVEHRTG